MKTELEANSCWCPQIHADNGANHSFAMPNNGKTILNVCISSRCMMWRWGYETSEHGHKTKMMVKTDVTWSCAHCDAIGKHPSFADTDNPKGWCPECEGVGHGRRSAFVGYCGLAGVPE